MASVCRRALGRFNDAAKSFLLRSFSMHSATKSPPASSLSHTRLIGRAPSIWSSTGTGSRKFGTIASQNPKLGDRLKRGSYFRTPIQSLSVGHPDDPPAPWVLVPPGVIEDETGNIIRDDDDSDYFHFFSLGQQKIIKIKKKFNDGGGSNAWWSWGASSSTGKGKAWKINELVLPNHCARCVGSSFGWLAFVNPPQQQQLPSSVFQSTLCLFNPFSESTSFPNYLPLPSVLSETVQNIPPTDLKKRDDGSYTYFYTSSSYSKFMVDKLVLSLDPSDDKVEKQCTALAIVGQGRDLAFCWPGDTSWTVLEGGAFSVKNNGGGYSEIFCSANDGLLYAVGYVGSDVEVWDLTTEPAPSVINLIQYPVIPKPELSCDPIKYDYECFVKKRFMAETSNGDLVMVVRSIAPYTPTNPMLDKYTGIDDGLEADMEGKSKDEYTYETNAVDVYKLEKEEKKWAFIPRSSELTYFVGLNNSFSLNALRHAKLVQDCVYYTDNFFERMDQLRIYGGHDSAICAHWTNFSEHVFPSPLKKLDHPPVFIQVPPGVKINGEETGKAGILGWLLVLLEEIGFHLAFEDWD